MTGCGGDDDTGSPPDRFDSDRAFELIEQQVAVGPRPAGSEALQGLGRKLLRRLPQGGVQPLAGGLRNLEGLIQGREPGIVVAAHYDTEATIPGHVGANDGAAGTAVLFGAEDRPHHLELLIAEPHDPHAGLLAASPRRTRLRAK